MKDFPTWMKLKQKLDGLTHRAPLVTEGNVWWASVGENVGSEIGGKNHQFSRPVIILKKLAHGFYFVIPPQAKKKRVPGIFHSNTKEKRWWHVCTNHVRLTIAGSHQSLALLMLLILSS